MTSVKTQLAKSLDITLTAMSNLNEPASNNSCEGDSITQESNVIYGSGWLKGKNGVALFEQWWSPELPKAAVAIVHGYAEHSSRYAHVAETFARHGYAVYAYDIRSHGKSEGKNTFINSFDDFVDDLDLFIQNIREEHIQPQSAILPFFILGHSLGGLITSRYLAIHQPDVHGVVLSGPYLAINDDVPHWLIRISSVVGELAPRFPTISIDYKYITRDPEMLERHQSDPLVYRGNIPARTGAEINRAVQQMQDEMEKVEAPLLILHGGADKIATIKGSHQIYERACSDDKALKIYEGLYHEILNEFEREEVKAEILKWMDERCVC